MYPTKRRLRLGALLIMSLWAAPMAQASSHMDAPLISLDDPANTTDVYAFKSRSGGVDYLTTALAVYPFEEPGIGPNNYRFDPAVDYEIHVALGNHVGSGSADLRASGAEGASPSPTRPRTPRGDRASCRSARTTPGERS